MLFMIARICITVAIAFLAGKLVTKIKMPAILGWLITGMFLGPHGFGIMSQDLLDARWYNDASSIMACALGLMIGTELVWSKLKRSGKAIFITTLTQSLGTFLVVSAVFAVAFYIADIPLYLSLIFGGIALATAPAPALSVVKEFKTDGPVTRTLIPMAALDDIVGCAVFLSVIAVVAGKLSAGQLPGYMIALVILLPLVIGVAVGFLAGMVLKKERSSKETLALLILTILLASGVGFFFNYVVLPAPVLNFMLIGMAFSATFANMVTPTRLEQIMGSIRPILGISIIVVILNLGAPLDYHLVLGAGLYTAIYIAARAAGKYFGAYFGASITKSPDTVKKYLGLTLLPHSGVSLVFTGIAVSVLAGPAPECAEILQGTIAAAAVINEVLAVIIAKKGFEWAGEFGKAGASQKTSEETAQTHKVITISRQYGSGGREIGKKLSSQLGIPFYDQELIELAAKSSSMDQNFFKNIENSDMGSILHDLSTGAQSGLSVNDQVFLHQSQIIQDVAEKGSCVIVGRCADYVLKNRPNVIKVFISASLDSRKHRIEKIYQETPEITLSEIEKTDKKRASYYHNYSHQNFGDAQNYDLCLSSSSLGIEECVKMIAAAYNLKQ